MESLCRRRFRFGKGTTIKLWEKTKKIAGYGRQPNGFVKGVGYSQNEQSQVWPEASL